MGCTHHPFLLLVSRTLRCCLANPEGSWFVSKAPWPSLIPAQYPFGRDVEGAALSTDADCMWRCWGMAGCVPRAGGSWEALASTCPKDTEPPRVSSEKGEETAFPKGRERRCWVRQLSWLNLKKSRKQSHLTPCHHQRLKGTQPECEGHCHRQTLLPQLSPHIRCPPLTPSKDSTPFLLTQISKKSATRN